jgi:predicted LPLAT superfamily acyltransferase
MSVELSHRLAWVAKQPPIIDLTLRERHELWLACERAAQFSDLTDRDQQRILQAEAARERAIAERRAATA